MAQQDFDRQMNDYYRNLDHDHAPDRLVERIESIPDTEPAPSYTPQRWRQRVGRWLGRDDGDMRSADVRGRSRPTKNGRNRLMITTATAAVAVAALALGVAYVDDAAITPESAPGAGAGVAVPDDWAFFTGELRYDGSWPAGVETAPYFENGLLVDWGSVGFGGQTFTTTDTRLTGTRSELEYALLSESVGGPTLWTERSRIENEEGAWTCVLTAVSVPATEGSADLPQSGWCDGSDAYEGYRAFMTIEGGGEAMDSVHVTGFVSDADVPVIPAAD
jgi:hypothetical protein